MSTHNPQRQGSHEDKGIRVLSELCSFAAIFFGAGPLFVETIDIVTAYSATYYGAEYEVYVNYVWGAACAALLYGSARTVSSILLSALRFRGLSGLLFRRFR